MSIITLVAFFIQKYEPEKKCERNEESFRLLQKENKKLKIQ